MDSVAPSSTTRLTFRVEGNSLPQLFENAARELLKVFINAEEVGEVLREKMVVEGIDTSALFQAWIDALLSLAARQRILFKANRFQVFEAERTGAGKLRAEITGELIDPIRHTLRREFAGWRCEKIQLVNSSQTIAAEIFLRRD